MFKKILLALATTTLVVSPVVTAQAQAATQHKQEVTRTVVKQKPNGRTVVTRKTSVQRHDNHRVTQHRWAKGQRFDRRHATNYRVINNYRGYHLNTPPRGYQWVQSGNDAILIAITGGIIGAVVGNAVR